MVLRAKTSGTRIKQINRPQKTEPEIENNATKKSFINKLDTEKISWLLGKESRDLASLHSQRIHQSKFQAN